MNEKQLTKALKEISKAFDADVRALKSVYIKEVGALQQRADESEVKKVCLSLRKKV